VLPSNTVPQWATASCLVTSLMRTAQQADR
jgi:hypothetical protein